MSEAAHPADRESALRRGLEPSADVVSRVVTAALRPRRPRAPIRLLAGAIFLLGLTLWAARGLRQETPGTTLTSGPGGIVVVRTADGAIALYQNAPPRPARQILIRKGGPS